jgi:hypothetical protein
MVEIYPYETGIFSEQESIRVEKAVHFISIIALNVNYIYLLEWASDIVCPPRITIGI